MSNKYELTKAKYLLDHEYQALNDLLTKYSETKSFRDCTLLWTLMHTGARATEVLNITKDDLDSFGSTVFIKGIKDSNNREIPIPRWLMKRLISLASDNPTLFKITYSRLAQVWYNFRPVKKRLHSLRHTFAIRLYKKTLSTQLVQYALGHRSIFNTQIYMQYEYSSRELRKLIVD